MMDIKKQRYFRSFLGMAGLIILNSCITSAPGSLDKPHDTAAIVELDSSIRQGRLSNGFTYFIKSLPTPQPKLYMRLYHNAGSDEEDPDQFDVAHGVEHLAFKATKNFPDGVGQSEIINRLGITIYDMLAYSGQTTEYYFDAPPGNKEALNTAFLWFKDIANGLNLTEKDINSVKGELRQEYLIGEGEDENEKKANEKLEAGFFPCRQEEPNFVENLSRQDTEVFRRFYRDWYRPDLLAISIVGNIEDIDSLENQIKSTFSDLEAVDHPRKLVNCDSLFNSRPSQFFVIERIPITSDILTDTKVNLEIMFRDPTTMNNLNNIKGINRLLLFQLLRGVTQDRMDEITKEYPYDSFKVGFRDIYKSSQLPSSLKISATLENPVEVKQALQDIIRVLLQLKKYGVSDAEWDQIKQKQLQYIQVKDENIVKYWIDEIKNFYTRGEALPNNKEALLNEWLTNLSLSEFNAFVSEFLSKKPEDIGIIAPSGHLALSLTEKEVRFWIKELYQEEVKSYEKPVIPNALMSSDEIERLVKPKIVEMGTSESGPQEFKLPNGIRLVFKQVEGTPGYDKDKIKIHGFAVKGTNCFPEDQFFSAIYSPSIVSFSGVNGINRHDLKRFLSKNNMTSGIVSPYLGRDEAGIQSTTSVDNFEIVLQLIYLYFTSTNKSEEAFLDWKTMIYKSNKQNPDLEFYDAIRKTTGDLSLISEIFGNKTLRQGGIEFFEGIEKINLDQSFDIFKKIFGNAEDFTFVITGDFEKDSIVPLAGKYLGNIPKSSSSLTCSSSNENNIFLSEGPKYVEFEAPANSNSNYLMYNIQFHQKVPTPLDWQEQLRVETLGWITTQKAWRLRFEMGLELYDVRVWTEVNYDMNRYEFSSTFKCVPEEYPIIRGEFHKIISEIKSGQISEELFQQGMYAMHLFYDLDQRGATHSKQHINLYEHYRFGQPLMDPVEVEKFVNSLTIDDVIEAANKYYKEENMYEFVMKDKKIGKEF